jgi:V8-like Glu-specific endopeptidase
MAVSIAKKDLPRGVFEEIVRVAEGPDVHARRVVDARLPPYAAVGRLSGNMVCTAALVVHPRIAVTAAHCVTSGNGLISLLSPIYASGYEAGGELGHFKALVWAIGAQQDFKGQSARDASNDWAVLLLEGAPAGVRPFLLSDQPADALIALGTGIEMPSYAIDVGGAQVLSLDPVCSIRKHAWNVLVHDCKTSSGGSGAPLLIRQQDWYAVIGIHTAAIWEQDQEHVMKPIGHEAVGSWSFADAIYTLDRRLEHGGDLAVAGPLAH